ncbi:MAG: helix-turn-helix domain-containing protein [Clostridiales bacterium]|nr:helix-turn-helix domain-containing protein [Clostridiales bacterium]
MPNNILNQLENLSKGKAGDTSSEPPQKPDKSGNSAGEIPEVVKSHRSNFALSIWEYLTEHVGKKGEVIQSEIAEAVGCSRRTVIRVLKGFKRCSLIDWKSYNGQGRGIQLNNHWLQTGEKIKEKLAWKRGFEKEAEYLKSRWTRQGQLGVTPFDYMGKSEQTLTQDQHQGVDSSSRKEFIQNSNLTRDQKREKYLEKFPESEKIANREDFQKILMVKLRTFLEDQNLDPKAVKATCDSYWSRLKNGTLGQAKKALKKLQNGVEDLIGQLREEFTGKAEEAYQVATRFIKFNILKNLESSNDRPKGSSGPRGSTPETFSQDKKKAEKTRQKGASEIIGEIFDGESFTLGGGEDDRQEKNKSRLETMKKALQNYGTSGLRRWARNHRISFAAAKEQLIEWRPELATEFET